MRKLKKLVGLIACFIGNILMLIVASMPIMIVAAAFMRIDLTSGSIVAFMLMLIPSSLCTAWTLNYRDNGRNWFALVKSNILKISELFVGQNNVSV